MKSIRHNRGSSGGSGGSGGSSSGTYYIKGKKDGTAFRSPAYPMATITSLAGVASVSLFKRSQFKRQQP